MTNNNRQNLVQILTEEDLDGCLDENSNRITLVLFSTKTCRGCKILVPKYVALAKKYPDCFFIMVDLHNFQNQQNKYTANIVNVPTVVYYYDNQQILGIEGPSDVELEENILYVLNKINTFLEKIKQQNTVPSSNQVSNHNIQVSNHNNQEPENVTPEQVISQLDDSIFENNSVNNNINIQNNNISSNQSSDVFPAQKSPEKMSQMNSNNEQKVEPKHEEKNDIDKKIELLKKLYDLKKNGVVINKIFSLDDTYDELLKEYEFHTKPKEVLTDPEAIQRKNREIEIQKIKELEIMYKLIQENQLKTLAKLKIIQQNKEQFEKQQSYEQYKKNKHDESHDNHESNHDSQERENIRRNVRRNVRRN